HSLHTERDRVQFTDAATERDFNPLSPYGERPTSNPINMPPSIISIHSLHTERDDTSIVFKIQFNISIHSLHTERDIHDVYHDAIMDHFNPLSPYGERLFLS